MMRSGVILLIAAADQGSLELSGCFSCSSVLWKNESNESMEAEEVGKSDVQRAVFKIRHPTLKSLPPKSPSRTKFQKK